jgi:hypothetical protein
MGTFIEDFERDGQEVSRKYSNGEVFDACLTLIAMGGEIAAILGAGLLGMTLASMFLPFASPAVMAAAFAKAYASMGTNERRAARIVYAWALGVAK